MFIILSKILSFVKSKANEIIMFILVLLLALFSFASGYIIAKYQDKEPIKIEQKQ